MKKITSQIFALTLIVSSIVSCDYVKNVNPPVEPNSGGGTATNVFVTDSTTGSNPLQQKVLVEDYTGHRCGNCPAAADTLIYLENKYPGKIVPMAVHAGYFAKTTATFPTSFTTTAGNTYDGTFGNAVAGNPNGLINRVGFPTTSHIQAYTAWDGKIAALLTQTPKFQILLKYKYETGTLKLDANVTVKSLANNTGIYKLVVLLTQDGIIAEQDDYRYTPSFIANYEFNHVLRGAINSEWGDAIFATGAPLNTTELKTYTNFQINSTFIPANCHILAYVYDADVASPTHYEVLQVEEIKLK